MITYLSFQKRLRALTLTVSKHSVQSTLPSISGGKIGSVAICNFVASDENVTRYIEGFDSVLASIGWNDNKLLSEIDKNWE